MMKVKFPSVSVFFPLRFKNWNVIILSSQANKLWLNSAFWLLNEMAKEAGVKRCREATIENQVLHKWVSKYYLVDMIMSRFWRNFSNQMFKRHVCLHLNGHFHRSHAKSKTEEESICLTAIWKMPIKLWMTRDFLITLSPE